MNTKTVLTDEEIIMIGKQVEAIEVGENGYILPVSFARAIEQAILQSLLAQKSNTIRGDSYAGVHVWLGINNALHHIPKIVAEKARDPKSMLEGVASECIKNLEQTVLQSPEVQALKRDKERLDWLADPNNNIGNVQLPRVCVERNLHSLRAAIDCAMEKKNESNN